VQFSSGTGNSCPQDSLVCRISGTGGLPAERELSLFGAIRDVLVAGTAGRRIRVVCVGTPLNAGDSLGPMTGTFLERLLTHLGHSGPAIEVVGTLADPIHATNLKQRMRAINSPDLFVLAVDASVGTPGEIVVKRGALLPGAGVGRTLPPIGEAQVLCAIARRSVGFWCAHMGSVLEMSELVSRCILKAVISAQRAVS